MRKRERARARSRRGCLDSRVFEFGLAGLALGLGFLQLGLDPADQSPTSVPAKDLAAASAIWLLQEFPVHKNRTFSLFGMLPPLYE